MSLKSKILIILALAASLYAALDFSIQRWIIFPNFVALERNEAIGSMELTLDILKKEIQHLNALCHDWASGDGTYRFAKDQNPEYIKSVLLDSSLSNDSLNLVCFYGLDGRLVWKKILDLPTKSRIDLSQFPANLPTTHPLISQGNPEKNIYGILITDRGAMILASRPILTSSDTGPARGRLIMGKFLHSGTPNSIGKQSNGKSHAIPLNEIDMSGIEREALNNISNDSTCYIDSKSKDILHAFSVIRDIHGSPALLMRIDLPRNITAKGKFVIDTALLSLLIITLLLMLLMMLMLQKIVVGPISTLTAQAEAIRNTSEVSTDLHVQSSDEIGKLTHSFNQLLHRLSKTRKNLLKQSYYAGMAEMAGEVLHNIRNDLSPMIIQIDILRENLKAAPIRQMQMAHQELIQGNCSEARKKDLIQFQDLALQRLAAQIQSMNTDLDRLSAWGSRVEKVLAERDKFSQTSRPIESMKLTDLLNEAMDLISHRVGNSINCELDQSMDNMAPILAHRTPLVHIFSNLISNAADAIHKSGEEKGIIKINALSQQRNDADFIHLFIADNGIGIDPTDIERIFDREYPRKSETSAGLGLHWCSNTIASMNGQIFAESEGIGKGACFHVLIPRSI